MRFSSVILATVAFATPAAAADWSCSNADIAEIRCDSSGCEIERESFTPMSLGISDTSIEICAYSGCFRGRVSIRRSAGELRFYHAIVRTGGSAERAAIILDSSTGSALLRWGSFANVMRCTRD